MRLSLLVLLASLVLNACTPALTPAATATATPTGSPIPTNTPTPSRTPTPTSTFTPTPQPLALNDPTPMGFDELRAGAPEMTVAGEAVSIEDFVRKYVETGAFSDWLVDHATKNGTLPTGFPPEGGINKNPDRYSLILDEIQPKATHLIKAGLPLGSLSGIRVSVGDFAPQDFAASQGVWEIKVRGAPSGDLNNDGAAGLWVRGVVLATGDPAHPYVGVPVVHLAPSELGGFDAVRDYMARHYSRTYGRFAVVKEDPEAGKIFLAAAIGERPQYLHTIALLHGLGLDDGGFEIPGGRTGSVVFGYYSTVPKAEVDPSLKRFTPDEWGWFQELLMSGTLSYGKLRGAVLVDASFFR